MTNEEAIELLKNMHWSITTKMNREVPSSLALLMAIEALGKDTNVPAKWIPVSERLPEEYCECLATYETVDGRKFLDILEYEPSYEYDHENHRFKGNWLFFDDDSRFTDGKVVAWMPLPEPYKEGE